MRKRNVLMAALLVCLGGLAAYGQSSPIKVEIATAQTAIQNNETFIVNTSIRNAGNDETVLAIWSCSYPQQWQADSPFVHVDAVGCKKNTVLQIRIKPGGTYDRPLQVRVESSAGSNVQESVTFRLAFQPAASGTAQKAAPVWSNAITVKVAK